MRPITIFGLATVLAATLIVSSPALAQDKGRGFNKGRGGGQQLIFGNGSGNGKIGRVTGSDRPGNVSAGSGVDTGGLPPGLAKQDPLPAGLAKRTALPPGLAKGHATPPGLAKRNQLPPGLQR